MREMDLGITKTCEFGDYIIIGFSKKFLRLNDGKPLEFNAKINENGELVLFGPQLVRSNSTRSYGFDRH